MLARTNRQGGTMGRLTRGNRNIKWIEEFCRIPEGKYAGQPVVLRPWQKRDIRTIYNSPSRTVIISEGRKNAKTTFAAFLLLLHLAGPEGKRNVNGQLYSAAQSRDQAAILFALAAKIVRLSPRLLAVVGIRDNAKQLYCDALGTLYRALSADASTAFGLSPVFVVHDEIGQVRGPRSALFEALETAMGAHDAPLSLIISTQAPTDADLLSVLIDDAAAGHDPETKLILRTVPDDRPGDPPRDIFSEASIKLANPAFGDFLNKKEVMRTAGKAKRMPSREAAYRNLVLNQRINQETPFIARAVWQMNQGAADLSVFERFPLKLALDLSARNDLTALAIRADDTETGFQHCQIRYFAPFTNHEERAKRDRVPYDLWAAEGHLTLTPGASVSYAAIALELVAICDQFDVEAIFFDRWRMDVLEAELTRLGVELPLVPHGQGYKDMAPALDLLESDLLNGVFRLGDNPLTNFCAANSVVDTDPAGNRKLNKAKSTGRIDGLVALAMTYGTIGADTEEHVTGGVMSA